MEKRQCFFQQMVLENWTYTSKKNLNTDFIAFIKINSNSIIRINVKCKTIKLLDNRIRENLGELRFGNNFLDTTPSTQPMKEKKKDKVNIIKIKTFFSVKDTAQRIKSQGTDWEKILAKHISVIII